jgi:hypothetical protein
MGIYYTSDPDDLKISGEGNDSSGCKDGPFAS